VLVAHGLKITAMEVNLASVAANKAVVAHKNDATKAASSIKAVQLMTQFTEAKRVHKDAVTAVAKARMDVDACIKRTTAARKEMKGLMTAASVAQTDAHRYKPQVVADAREMLVADKALKQHWRVCIQLEAELETAQTAQQFAAESLTTAQAADAVARKAQAPSVTQPVSKARTPLPHLKTVPP
jgi:hypothetical protein